MLNKRFKEEEKMVVQCKKGLIQKCNKEAILHFRLKLDTRPWIPSDYVLSSFEASNYKQTFDFKGLMIVQFYQLKHFLEHRARRDDHLNFTLGST